MTAATGPDWFVPLGDTTAATTHLAVIPQAGGGCATFASVADRLAPDVGVWSANFPARQARFLEPRCTDLDAVLDGLAADWPTPGPRTLFGYCSGALLAFLLARRLRDGGLDGPAALVVASYPAPDLARPPRDLHDAEPDRFWREILAAGGVPRILAEQPDHRAIFEAGLRMDYALFADWVLAPGAPLDIPVVALRGAEESALSENAVTGWSRHTTGAFRLVTVPGGHWILDSAHDPLVAVLREAVGAAETS